MILTYHGGACIKATAGDTSLVFGPVSKASKKFKSANFGVDIAFVSLNDADMNGTAEVARGSADPFIIQGPGEYEVKDITAAGFPSKSVYGGHERINTIYSIKFDGLSVLYYGAGSTSELPKEVIEMDAPDILILPIGGEGTLGSSEAQKLAVKLEAKVIIPVLYDDKSLKQFLKEASSEGVKPVDKLTIKPRDLSGKDNEVVVLAA